MSEELLVFPASFAQARLWFLDQLDPGNPAYNIAAGVRMRGSFDDEVMAAAILAIVHRHEILRTTFVGVDGEPMQIVGKEAEVDTSVVSLEHLSETVREAELQRLAGEAGRETFDLEKGPLLRTRLLVLSETDRALVLVMHHVVSDLWSVGVFFRELFAIYESLASGGASDLPELPIQYADYAHWQKRWFDEDAERVSQLDYWKEQLAGHLPRVELPLERRHLARGGTGDGGGADGARVVVHLDRELTRSLERLGRTQGKTLFMTLFSAFQVLLHRYSGQEELVVGTAVANRARPELAGLIGFFVNTLVLRVEVSGKETFSEVLDHVSDVALEAFAHQDLPFDKLVEELAPERRQSRTPLFRVMFALQNAPLPELALSGLTLSEIAVDRRAAPFDLALFCRETDGALQLVAEFATDCLDEATVRRLLDHYRFLLDGIARDPDRTIGDYRLLDDEQRRLLLAASGGGGTREAARVGSCVHEWFEREARRRPDAVALEIPCGGSGDDAVVATAERMTYRELDQRANRLAHHLRSLGVGPESMVAVCLERSFDLVVAILATLKSGGAYVPLDPSYPAARLAFVLEDSEASVLLSDTAASATVPAGDIALVLVDRDREDIAKRAATRPKVNVSRENLAYVIYTSGSTGRPKGVGVEHRNVTRLFDQTDEWFHFGERDVWSLFHSYAFDFSVWELWGALGFGGRLVVVPHDVSRSPRAFCRLLEEHEVTVLNQTPSAFRQLIDAETELDLRGKLALRCVIFGGEALDPPSLRPWLERHGDETPELVNMYGITETTVHVTYRMVHRTDADSPASTIGRPIPDLSVHLLDANGNLVPVGAAGEIHVGGPGLSRGYLGRPELTAERFVPDPFGSAPGERLYKTGDRARRLLNGELEYLGRLDQQVKVRGFRVELGEIERSIEQHEAIEACVVVLSEETDRAGMGLVAYAVPHRERALPVRRWLELSRRGALEGKRTYELPDGTALVHQNRSETDFMYEEIFERRSYLKHGIVIEEGDVIFDVGANIGLFTLFAARAASHVKIYAFEPIPPLFESLRDNAELSGADTTPLNYGLSDRPRHETFRFYPHATVLSGRHADAGEERAVVKAFLLDDVSSSGTGSGQLVDEVLQERLESEAYRCELKTLSDVMTELGVEHIRLLKIDVEKSEHEVLDGIRDEDWPKIDQVIVEVHDLDGRLAEIESKLSRHGYRTRVEQDEALARTGLYNIYATRRRTARPTRAKTEHRPAPPIFRSPARLSSELRRFVSERLPAHMVPSSFVLLDALPLTPQGKLDRRALPDPADDVVPSAVDVEAPRTPVEASVLSIYQDVLRRESLGVDDDFFELGGHSLLATQLIARARAVFQVEIPVRRLFESPTPAALARFIDEALGTDRREVLPPITHIPRDASVPLPLSFAQRRLLFLHELAPASSAYLAAGAVRLTGELHRDVLRDALSEIVRRHEILRTFFGLSTGEPRQEIAPPQPVVLPLVDLSRLGRVEREAEARRRIATESRRSFDLGRAPLLRALLMKLGDEEHILVVTMHHLVSDGWSVGVLVRELGVLYDAFAAGRPSPLPEPEVQYADYAQWQRLCLEEGKLEGELAYWRKTLDSPPTLALPTDRPRPAVQRFQGRRHPFVLSQELTRALDTLSRREGVTLFMTLLAAFQTLLFRYSGQDDVVVGTPIANRKERQTERLIGCFVNTLVLRSDLSGDPQFDELLDRVRDVTLGAYGNQDVPFEKLVEELQPDRALSRHPLFQAVFSFENATQEELQLSGLRATAVPIEDRDAKFDLVLTLLRDKNGLGGWFEYDRDLFTVTTITRMSEHLAVLLESIVAEPARRLSDLPLVSPEQRARLLRLAHPADASSPRERENPSVLASFREQTAARPDALALASGSSGLSYRELDVLSSRIARRLLELGLSTEDRVAVCCHRSPRWVACLLAVLKAGGAFVPLDPTLPTRRLHSMLDDAAVTLVLTERSLSERFAIADRVTLALDDDWGSEGSAESLDVDVDVDAPGEQLAYVIFTSGSTGRPKGVAIPHRGLANLVAWHKRAHRVNPEDRATQIAGLGFDASVWEIWPYLSAGASVHFPDDETHASPAKLARWLRQERISVSFLPTPLAEAVMASPVRVSGAEGFGGMRLLTGGDVLHRAPGPHLDLELFNHYGPTENTVVTSWCAVPPRPDTREPGLPEPPPIGRAIDGTRARVLGAGMDLVPLGVVGELFVGGAGLARGYLGDPATTAERFVPDPYADAPGQRLYRTGDRVRMSEDGLLHFHGRADEQVKLRGFRIELGEIETVLAEHEAVSSAAVCLREVRGESRLVAFVVWNGSPREAAARQFLRERLSESMVPALFVALPSMPLTPNGKVDKKALPLVSTATDLESEPVVAPPRDRLEEGIAAIWRSTLKVETVGIDDNFFDVGGHSLLLVQVHRRLAESYPEASLSVIELFQNPTIRTLSRRIRGEEPSPVAPSGHARARRPDGTGEPIAIVGMAGRFPKAGRVEELWANLRSGRECITSFSEEELRGRVPETLLSDPSYVKARGVIDDAELFDAEFFGYNAREAELLDPQQRVFLEVAWEGLERAGLANARYHGRVGVFAGSSANSYVANLLSHPELVESVGTFLTTIANDKDFLATRVSYKLNLRGPSVTVQTACSTSLVAVHLACQSLRLDECDVALAGGVSVGAPRKRGYLYTPGGIQSVDGHCRAFDARASGTVAGEGAGIVVLKRLSDAVKEGDRVEAVILGSAINNDGSLKVGFTAPSVDGQAEVLSRALSEAGVPPSSLTYVETHGTGTSLGDPIEVSALKMVFDHRDRDGTRCGLGSVKSNLGHLDAAAGVASLIKTTLALGHEQIPASLHFERANPELGLASSPFYVNRELRPWPRDAEVPRRAGVSSFGIGGTNAHVVLEESPGVDPASTTASPRRHQLLPWSAKTESAAERMTEALARHLEERPAENLADVSFTLTTGRSRFSHRRFLVGCDDAAAAARVLTEGTKIEARVDETARRAVAFVFPGQGSQYVNMGRELYRSESLFRDELDEGFRILRSELDLDVKELVYPKAGAEAEAAGALRETRVTQPLLFLMEHALASLLRSWGLLPEALLGHSIGEYVAASLAGVFDLERGLELTALRGRLMQSAPSGSMTSVALSEEELQSSLPAGLSLAAVNGARLTVVSGSTARVRAFEAELSRTDVTFRRLETSHAFHSELMDPVVRRFEEAIGNKRFDPPQIPFVSNVTGTWIEQSDARDPAYWARHLRAPVRFTEGVRTLLDGSRAVVEVGPGRVLAGELRRQAIVVPTLGNAGGSDAETLATSVGRLWLAGVDIDWTGYFATERRRRVLLPTYVFDRQRYWIDASQEDEDARSAAPKGIHRSPNLSDWFYLPSWTRSLTRTSPKPCTEDAGRWLLLRDASGLGAAMAKRLRALGHDAVEVDVGRSFARRADGTYTIDAAEPAHYRRLLGELCRGDLRLSHVVHAWSVSPHDDPALDDVSAIDFQSFVLLAQAVVATPELEEVRLGVVTHRAQGVLPGDAIVSERSAVLGAIRVLPQEHATLTCCAVDVSAKDGGPWQVDQVGPLLAELAEGGNDIVAYRGLQRWSETTTPIELALEASSTSLRHGGTYLITGGLGNVGLAIAEHLAESMKANLVLVARTPLGDDERSRRVSVLEQKVPVLVETADVSRPEELERAFSSAEARFGRVDGVIHAAGITGPSAFRTLVELTSSDVAAQFDAKVRGASALAAVLDDRDVDFCVLCSSLSTVLGGLGFAAYAAANRFMDAIAERMTSRGKPWLAIDWDGWKFREAPEGEGEASRLGATLRHLLMTPAEGVETFERALQLVGRPGASSVIVSTGELESRRKQWLQKPPCVATSLPRRSRPVLRSAFAAPTSPLEREIAAIWQELLGVEIGMDDDFFELGGHSLLATQVVSRLRKNRRVEVPLTRFFVAPTVRRLTEVVLEQERSPTVSGSRLESVGGDREAHRPLSFAQQRLWFFDQMSPGSSTYNFSQPCRHRGSIDPGHLRTSLRTLLARHHVLRTSFVTVNGEPRQTLHDEPELPFSLVDLGSIPVELREAEAIRLARAEAETPFDLARGPLIRIALVLLEPEEQVLLVTMHHIVTDGWSLRIFFDELARCYQAVSRGEAPELAPLPIQYADFAAWQREWLSGQHLSSELGYWTERLAGAPPFLTLPTDRIRPTEQSFRGARVSRLLPSSTAKALLAVGGAERATLFMSLLAIFEAMLHRLSGQDDLVVGTPAAGRNRAETEGLIGFFINTLVLRTDLSGSPSFRDLLRRVRDVCLEAYDHQDLPFEKLVEVLAPARDLGRTPLFQVMFNLLNFETRERETAGLVLEGLAPSRGASEPWNPDVDSKFDLTLYASERPEGINLLLVYNADLFDRSRMVELLATFEHLASQVVRAPERSVADLSLLTAAAQERLPDPRARLESSSRRKWKGGVAAVIAARARRHPKRTAVVDASGTTTYGSLVERVRELGNRLRALGVGAEDTVAVYGARHRDLVVALLGVWHAGASFVVLDPRYPASSLASRIVAARPRGWVRVEGTPEPGEPLRGVLAGLPVAVDLGPGLAEPPPSEPLELPRSPETRAYLAFTSGSTGEPKAVVGTHAPLAHFVSWQTERFELGAADRFAMLSGLAYDPLLRDILTPLSCGATLVIPSDEVLAGDGLLDWLERESITVVHITPSMLRMLVGLSGEADAGLLRRLRYAFVGGEALSGDDVRRLRRIAPSVQCVNFYGTTETPQAVAYRIVTPSDEQRPNVPLGHGVEGTQLIVLSPSGEQAGIGELGEIHVRSLNLSPGYWDDEALTSARFATSPFDVEDDARFYRTGDLGRYLPDGAVAFCGRNDHQVKLRGHRVELGEIESFLRRHPSAERNVVLCREDSPGDKRIVAYIEGSALSGPARSELESFLAEKIPDFMVPFAFVSVDAFPLTPNGKIDRSALPAPERPVSDAFVAPRSAVERVVARLWSELLDLERVSVRDDFFGLGGHSLLATQLISRVTEVLGVRLSLKVIFEAPTVEGMVQALARDAADHVRLSERAELLLKLAEMSEDEGEVESVIDERASAPEAGGR